MKKKFILTVLGCKTNQYEAQVYIDQLKSLGLSLAEKGEEADLCILNSCAVTQEAEENSKKRIQVFAKEHPRAEIWVTGCLAEKECSEGRIHWISNGEKEYLVEKIFPEKKVPPFFLKGCTGHTRAFVKIQEGCDHFCSYCIVPQRRGFSRSRKISEIVAEVKQLVERGYKEVVFVGIHIGDFDGGERGKKKLAFLLQDLCAIEGLLRIRLSSIGAEEVDLELEKILVQNEKICPSLHLVLQSGSDRILKKMRRCHTQKVFLECVHRLRKTRKDFAFTTDVIIGFPGESEEDFLETLKVVREVRFVKIHIFPFSPRPGTEAFSYPDKVSLKIIHQRKERLAVEAEKVAFNLRKDFLGKTYPLLIEQKSEKEKVFSGYTPNFFRVEVVAPGLCANRLVDVVLKENTPQGFIGLCISK